MKTIQKTFPVVTVCCLLIMLAGCRQPAAKVALPSVLPEQENVVSDEVADPVKPQKAIKQMTVEEALEAVKYYEFINHQALLVATYQHIIAKSKDPETVATHLIKLADLYFIDNNCEEAKKYYKKATMLYPGHPGIENARYREVMTHFLSSLNASRDQSATQTTINLGKKYLVDFPQAEPERVRTIIAAAYKKLLQSELLVINFYLNKFKLNGTAQPIQAALQRMAGVADVLLPQLKLYDSAAAKIQAQEAWSHSVFLPWSTSLSDNLDTDASRQEVIAKLEQAIPLLQTIAEGTLSSSTTVSNAERF